MLLRIGKTTVNIDRVQEICDLGDEIRFVFSVEDITTFRKPAEVEALRIWLAERSVDLLKAQAVAA